MSVLAPGGGEHDIFDKVFAVLYFMLEAAPPQYMPLLILASRSWRIMRVCYVIGTSISEVASMSLHYCRPRSMPAVIMSS